MEQIMILSIVMCFPGVHAILMLFIMTFNVYPTFVSGLYPG